MSSKKINNLLTKAIDFINFNQHHLAINNLEKIIKFDPSHFVALMNLGVCRYALGDYSVAAKIFHQLHEKDPDNLQINKYAGISYTRSGQYDLALKFLSRAVKSSPKDTDLLGCLANLLVLMNRETDAIYFATQAIAVDPLSPTNYNNLGSCLFSLNRFEDALTCFQTALDLNSDDFDALSNYSNSLNKLLKHNESIINYRKCLELPNITLNQIHEIRYKMSLPLLSSGQLEEGWTQFEYGLLYEDAQSRRPKRQFDVPKWNGSKIQGKTLMVWREQGLGDELDLLSLVPQLFDYCDDVIIESDSRLINLLQRSFPNCRIREQSYNPITFTQNNPADFDFHIALGSLPFYFMRKLEDINKIKPYLIPNHGMSNLFKDKLHVNQSNKYVGICWRSGLNNTSRNSNYTSILDLEPILTLPNISFVNLQYGDSQKELISAEKEFGIKIINFEELDLKNNLEGVCALINALDVVVSAGTAVASLTGALGKPLKLYRHAGWDLLGTNIYPWAPETDLYLSDQSGDFKPLIAEIAKSLKEDNSF